MRPYGSVSRWIFGTRACTMRFTGSHVPRGRVPSYWVSRSQRRLKSLVWLHEFLKRSLKLLHYQLAKNVLSNCNYKIRWNSSKRLIRRIILAYRVVKWKERDTERKRSVCREFNCKPNAQTRCRKFASAVVKFSQLNHFRSSNVLMYSIFYLFVIWTRREFPLTVTVKIFVCPKFALLHLFIAYTLSLFVWKWKSNKYSTLDMHINSEQQTINFESDLCILSALRTTIQVMLINRLNFSTLTHFLISFVIPLLSSLRLDSDIFIEREIRGNS